MKISADRCEKAKCKLFKKMVENIDEGNWRVIDPEKLKKLISVMSHSNPISPEMKKIIEEDIQKEMEKKEPSND